LRHKSKARQRVRIGNEGQTSATANYFGDIFRFHLVGQITENTEDRATGQQAGECVQRGHYHHIPKEINRMNLGIYE